MAYSASNFDNLQTADRLKIERSVYIYEDKAEISHLTVLPLSQLQNMREESAAAEQAIYEKLRESAKTWEVQAGNTLSMDKAIEYLKTPPVKHTANKWEKDEHNYTEISNMVYQMSYRISENTTYNHEMQKTVPTSWDLTWSVHTNTSRGQRGVRIAGQSQKRFTDKADMEKYLNGRIKAHSHLFTEISPPIPKEYADSFRVSGQLLPGYTTQGEEPKQPTRAADIPVGGVSADESRKERENMNEPLNIQLVTRESYITREAGNIEGAWLKLPATGQQLDAALARIGARGGEHGRDYFINGIETPIPVFDKISLESIQKAGIDELNFLAAGIENLDDAQIDKLNAASEVMPELTDVRRLAEFPQNTDFYLHLPGISNYKQLGDYYLNKSDMVDMPEAWKGAVDVEKLGMIAVEKEKGAFTELGYLIETGDEWKPVAEIPQEYQIAPKTEKPERGAEQKDNANADYEAIATRAPVATAVAAAPFVLVADNPRDKLKEITDKLENGIKGIFDSEQYKKTLETFAKFHNYSMNNCLLIALQNPGATHVGGFNFWRDEMKRPVMKGEKGIKIFAPAPFKAKKEVDKVDANGQPVIGADGRRVKVEQEVTIPAFKVTSVFDVSQTEGEPLPSLGVNELAGSVDKYKDFFAALEKTSPVPVGFEPITSGAKGYYHLEEKRIAINEGMSELQNLKTAIHEIAHSRLHAIDKNAPKDTPRPDRQTREVEAESIAYTVCQHYGLDTSDYSFGYVATWSGSKQLDTLKSSLDIIRKEADAIITEVDKHFAELAQGLDKAADKSAPEQPAPNSEPVFTDWKFDGGRVEANGQDNQLQVFFDGKPYADIRGELKSNGFRWTPDVGAWQTKLNDNAFVAADRIQGIQPLTGEKPTELLNQARTEAVQPIERPAPQQGDSFTIYQLKDGDATRELRFEPLDSLKNTPDLANYVNVYAAPLVSGTTLEKIHFTFNMDKPDGFKGHSLSISDVVVTNTGGKETAFYVDSTGFKELPEFLSVKEHAQEKLTPAFDLTTVADYMQKQNETIQAADPDKKQGQAAYSAAIKRLEQATGRIPDEHPQLKALLSHAAQSPDLATLKERMNTLNNEFIQHYSTAVQMSIDTGGKAEPPTPAATVRQTEPMPPQKPPTQGENVAEIEARVKAGEVVNLTDLSNAIQKDKQTAAQKTQSGKDAPQSPAKSGARTTAKNKDWKATQSQDAWDRAQGKTAAKPTPEKPSVKTEQPSIKEQIAAGKKQLSAQKPAPTRAQAKTAEIGG